MTEQIQLLASGKAAMGVGISLATTELWISSITNSATLQFLLVLLGAIVSVSILIINVQTFKTRKLKSVEDSDKASREREIDRLRLRQLIRQEKAQQELEAAL